MKHWCWVSIQMKNIQVGNYVSTSLSTHPRKIVKVVNENGNVTLYEEHRETPYQSNNENHLMDLLIDCDTNKPVTKEQFNEVFGTLSI